MTRFLVLLSLSLFLIQLSFAQTIESHVDYTVSPGVLQSGSIQYSQEWLEPSEFKNKELRAIDLVGVANLHPDNIKLVAGKVAFISTKSFDELTYAKMNKADFISGMLASVAISSMGPDFWRVTNKVKAYGLPFKTSFDFKFKEVAASAISGAANYLKAEGYAFRGPGRERFLTLDMTNFTMLMYRNYCIVYIKEISPTETLLVAGVIAGFDIDRAETFFPFNTRSPMMNNMKTQVMNMARNIQKAD